MSQLERKKEKMYNRNMASQNSNDTEKCINNNCKNVALVIS